MVRHGSSSLHVHGMALCAPTAEQARRVGRSDIIDTHSDLWFTCMHEHAHAQAGHEYGWAVSWPVVEGERTAHVHIDLTGKMKREVAQYDTPPRLFWLQDAVISACGPMMSEEFEHNPAGCEPDRERVRENMHESDITLAEITAESRRIIRQRYARIERGAVKLYRQYVAQFADKEYAS